MNATARLTKHVAMTTAIIAMSIFGLAFVLSTAGLTAAGTVALSYTKSQLNIAPHRIEKTNGRRIAERADQMVAITAAMRQTHKEKETAT